MAVYGPENSDELYHWKYTSKKRVNGKWRYYYDNDKLGIKAFIDTKITGNAQKQHASEALVERENANIDLHNQTKEYASEKASQNHARKHDHSLGMMKNENRRLYQKYLDKGNEYISARNSYYKDSLAGIASMSVDKGLKYLSRLKRKIKKKINSK